MKTRIIRSAKRRKTVQARKVGDVIEVLAPAHMSDAELAPVVDKLVQRLTRQAQKEALDDAALERRAQELNRRYFDGQLTWESIRWVTNQNGRFGSCTPAKRTIR
ncbi:MAG: hypothetical protein KDD78_08400, partial [Caldilineaceae bacterium]|nr:hypothetical protein [Caldilineaceae bacterium]